MTFSEIYYWSSMLVKKTEIGYYEQELERLNLYKKYFVDLRKTCRVVEGAATIVGASCIFGLGLLFKSDILALKITGVAASFFVGRVFVSKVPLFCRMEQCVREANSVNFDFLINEVSNEKNELQRKYDEIEALSIDEAVDILWKEENEEEQKALVKK